MTPWRFEGARNPEPRIFPIVPVAAGLFGRCRSRGRSGRSRRSRRGARGTTGGRGCRRGRSRSRLWLGRRIDPAGVNAAVERLGHLGIDLTAKAGQAAEGCLDMAARAAKTVVEIEVTKGGVEDRKSTRLN